MRISICGYHKLWPCNVMLREKRFREKTVSELATTRVWPMLEAHVWGRQCRGSRRSTEGGDKAVTRHGKALKRDWWHLAEFRGKEPLFRRRACSTVQKCAAF